MLKAKHPLTGLVRDKGSSFLVSLSSRKAAKGLNLNSWVLSSSLYRYPHIAWWGQPRKAVLPGLVRFIGGQRE